MTITYYYFCIALLYFLKELYEIHVVVHKAVTVMVLYIKSLQIYCDSLTLQAGTIENFYNTEV